MASLQVLPLCFLLVTTQGSNKFRNFTCDEDVTAELGKNINITCENNQSMHNATVKFCPNKTSCPEKSDLSSIRKKYITDNGRISLTMINQSVILNVHKVKISDQRHYEFFLQAVNGFDTRIIYLKVVAPYSEPQIKIQKDTVVCTASGGHPKRQLYWFSDHGTNLTHNSKLVSSKNEDGSFSLISTLQRQSLDSDTICCSILNNNNSKLVSSKNEDGSFSLNSTLQRQSLGSDTICCSILNNNTNCDKLQGSARDHVGNETTANKLSQDAEKKIVIPVLIVITLAAICAVIMVFLHRKKKGAFSGAIRNAYFQRLFLSEDYTGTSVTNQIEVNAVTGSRNTWKTVTLQDPAIQIAKARDSV
nr:butyrophilin-like protein 2 isoform X1 [Zootoca vivipara]